MAIPAGSVTVTVTLVLPGARAVIVRVLPTDSTEATPTLALAAVKVRASPSGSLK